MELLILGSGLLLGDGLWVEVRTIGWRVAALKIFLKSILKSLDGLLSVRVNVYGVVVGRLGIGGGMMLVGAELDGRLFEANSKLIRS